MSSSEAASQKPDEEQPPVVLFHLDLHSWLDVQQTSHGVRHDDYAQYHAYCTRRLSRLAHKPKDARAHLVHSGKYATPNPDKPKTPGGRHAFCGRTHDTLALTKEIEVVVENEDDGTAAAAATTTTTTTTTTDETPTTAFTKKTIVSVPVPHVNILWHLLVSSERSWAHANEIRKKGGRNKRQYVLKKLKRAHQWATILVEKAKISADSETQVEVEAYQAWMSANYAMEQMKYQTASENYARAMTLCHELSGESDTPQTSDDQEGKADENDDVLQRLEKHDLFVTRADTILRPMFRYCQYELKQAGEPTMEEPRLPSSGKQNDDDDNDEDSIVFRDRELLLDNKDLRVLILKFQSVEQELKDEGDKETTTQVHKETQFLTALSILDDAIEVIQSLEQGLSTKASSVSGPAVQAKLEQYALWRGYLQYTKTTKVMEHTENLVVSTTSMGQSEKVHVYDAVLQHAKSLLNLPRPSESEESAAASEEDDEFVLQVQANILRLRALKTYYMGWSYFTQLHKHGPALALLEHSSDLAKRAEEEIAACDEDMPLSEEYLKQLEDLPLESSIGAIKASMALSQRQQARKLQKATAGMGGSGEPGTTVNLASITTTDRPLLLRLNDCDGGILLAPIADLKPMPLPCKPVFYDLAYGHAVDTHASFDRLEAFLYQHTKAPVSSSSESKEDEHASSSGGSRMFGWLTGGSN